MPDKSSKTIRSVRFDQETLDQIETIGYWTRTTTGDVIRKAVQDYFDRLEKERGEPFPKR